VNGDAGAAPYAASAPPVSNIDARYSDLLVFIVVLRLSGFYNFG
jgi:hypothetical protein